MRRIFYFMLALALIILLGVVSLATTDNLYRPAPPKEEEIIEEPDRRASIIMFGDALIHNGIYIDASVGKGKYDFSSMFSEIELILAEYDLRYYNQETVIGGKNLGLSGYPRFNSPDEIGENLATAGFNLVSLANNHTMDKNEKGVLHSVNFWRKQEGVYTAGSYDSWESRNEGTIFEQNGVTFAFLAYTRSTNGISVPKGKEYLVNVYNRDTVRKDVENARARGAEVVMVSMHWGSEYQHTPNDYQKREAQYMASLGVDLIIGAHPHVIQPIDYIGNTLVIYSLGNFISGQRTLGIAKIIGLMVGVEIVVDKDSNVRFENLDYQLHYTYDKPNYKNYKVIPFSNLNEKILKNYKSIEEKYLDIVEQEVKY